MAKHKVKGTANRDVNKDNQNKQRLPNRIEMMVFEATKFLANRIVAASFGYAGMMKLTALNGNKIYVARSAIFIIGDYYGDNQEIVGSLITSRGQEEIAVREKKDDIADLMGYDGTEIKNDESTMQEPKQANTENLP